MRKRESEGNKIKEQFRTYIMIIIIMMLYTKQISKIFKQLNVIIIIIKQCLQQKKKVIY